MLMNLADPELELIDPTPNIHSLFIHFDKMFFWAKLASRAVVRWSKRMYSCAGICSYDRGGLCDIALSEPLLKLRPRKDLVETLLHEMIHAYLFITCRDQDRDGHGPNFKAHMYRINQAAGLNISIYHDFHDEVRLYQNHWWRCNGPCQTRKPHFGVVRRSMNRPPGPSDYWWESHRRNCGGTFEKIKEPEKPEKPVKKASPKPPGDITKFITKSKDKENDKHKPSTKDYKVPVKSNSVKKINSTIVVSKKNNIVFNPQVAKSPENKPIPFSGNGQTISGRSRTSCDGVIETVRNVWANKTIPTKATETTNQKKDPKRNSINFTNPNKHKAEKTLLSPPTKIKKIDDYFKSSATSLLKDIYGQDFDLRETENKRLSVIPVDKNMVGCPVCNTKICDSKINWHLDECLNKDVIANICNSENLKSVISIKSESDNINNVHKSKDVGNKNEFITINKNKSKIKIESNVTNSTTNFANTKTDINANIFKVSESKSSKPELLTPKEEISPILNKIPKIKVEPGTSKEIGQTCPCCGKFVDEIVEHLDECLAFFDNNDTIPVEGPSTSYETIVIDDDLDESLTLNATGTKSPCPCCLKMIEQTDMNDHLDVCLN